VLVDVELLIGGGQDLALVDVVHAERFQDLRLDKVPDAAFRHHRDRHGFLDLGDHLGVAHAGDAAVAPDVGRDALQGHHRRRARALGDFRLLDVCNVHYYAAFKHLGEPNLNRELFVLRHTSLLYRNALKIPESGHAGVPGARE